MSRPKMFRDLDGGGLGTKTGALLSSRGSDHGEGIFQVEIVKQSESVLGQNHRT